MDFSIIPDIPIKFMTKKQNSHYHFSVVFSPSSYSVISVVRDL
ncbi:Transthyretin-like protein [Francisella orientalis str. Toba 04]|nr:Transthyretin-like protein [Francisella orientalis]AFJ43365.1 Transthyretin-like protein [Francisella orientalis str. Toba 04]